MRPSDLSLPAGDPTRPTIAWDVARLISACDTATANAGAVPLDAYATVAAAIAARTTGYAPRVSSRDICVAALAEHAGAQARAFGRTAKATKNADVHAAARTLDRCVRSGDFAATVAAAWDEVEAPGNLDEYITDISLMGIPGEHLCWTLVGYEAQRHIKLIWHEAHKLTRIFPDRTASDLFGWGWQGLRVALRKYELEQGFKFSTYACQRINGHIRDGVRQENPVPKRLTTFVRKVARAEEELAAELGRVPRIAEVAERLGETLETLKILPRLSPSASIEELTAAAGERGGDPSVLIANVDPADIAVLAAMRDAIDDAMAALSSEDAEAVRLLVYEGRSVAEARAATGATARQLRQRCARGKELLSVALAEWAPDYV